MDTHELDAISRPYFDRKEPVSHQSESKTEQYGLKKRVTKDMIKSKLWRGNDTHDEISTEDIELRNIESGQEFKLLKGVQNWEKHKSITSKLRRKDEKLETADQASHFQEHEKNQNEKFCRLLMHSLVGHPKYSRSQMDFTENWT